MRVVIDTNQLVAALARHPELATLIMAWESARFQVIASSDLVAEYLRVLDYPDIKAILYPELKRAFASHLVHDIEMVNTPEIPRVCRDPDDDKVIATAIYGLADVILTIDRDLLTLEIDSLLSEFGVKVMAADAFVRLLDIRKE
jgi:hypothetical protein